MRLIFCLLCPSPLLIAHASGAVVDVAVPRAAAPLDRIFYHAQGIATEIYARIGVQLRWRRPGTREPERSNGLMHCTILLAFSWNTPSDSHPGALAFANPSTVGGDAATVFMDRLKPLADHNPIGCAFLLGHVLAHEIGHVLQGIIRHSATGVLKEHWSELEIRRMQVERLRFTDYDAALIRDGIRSRTGRK
jgi:hypothetical protein